MPTHEETARFRDDWERLNPEQQVLFMAAVLEIVDDLSDRGRFRASLHVKELHDHSGVFELSWSGDGRATFQYEREKQPGETHILWRRVGGGEILDDP